MRRRSLAIGLLAAWFGVTAVGTGFAQKGAPRQADKNVMAIENVKQLLLIMDTDRMGKISKQQWMAFMEAEFDRLDLQKKGEVDQKVIRQATEYVKQARSADLGR